MNVRPSMRDAVLALKAEGKSHSEVADALGISRSAVAGYVNRHREKSAPAEVRAEARKIRNIKRQVKRAENRERPPVTLKGAPRLPPPPPRPLVPPTLPEPVTEGVSILHVRFGQCRWVLPRKHEGLAVFCGEPTLTGKSWCAHHNARMFQAPPPPAKSAKKPLRRIAR
jgi:hypothetical protein